MVSEIQLPSELHTRIRLDSKSHKSANLWKDLQTADDDEDDDADDDVPREENVP